VASGGQVPVVSGCDNALQWARIILLLESSLKPADLARFQNDYSVEITEPNTVAKRQQNKQQDQVGVVQYSET
jgi:hypothetical protein